MINVSNDTKEKLVKCFCKEKCYELISMNEIGIKVYEVNDIIKWDEIVDYFIPFATWINL